LSVSYCDLTNGCQHRFLFRQSESVHLSDPAELKLTRPRSRASIPEIGQHERIECAFTSTNSRISRGVPIAPPLTEDAGEACAEDKEYHAYKQPDFGFSD
jgi:hypothetical protein